MTKRGEKLKDLGISAHESSAVACLATPYGTGHGFLISPG